LDFDYDTTPSFSKSARINGLNHVRLFAAIHIVVFHYYKKAQWNKLGVINPEDQPWITWGGQWVQFFFVLSGFLTTYTRLSNPARLTQTGFQCWKYSVRKVYPTYIISIVLTLLTQTDYFMLWRSLPAQLLFVFNWGANLSCKTPDRKIFTGSDQWRNFQCVEGLNEPAWYIGALQVYWYLSPTIIQALAPLSALKVAALLLLTWSLTLFWPLLLTFQSVEIAMAEGTGWRTFQEYNPLSHLHKFVFGMCVARLFLDIFCRKHENGRLHIDTKTAQRVAEAAFIVPIAVLVLVYLACSGSIFEFLFLGLSSYEFVLLPLFAALIVGLALERDPISKLLALWPLNLLNNYDLSFEIYILQGCAWTTTNVLTQYFRSQQDKQVDKQVYLLTYPVVLFSVSWFCWYFVK